MRDGEIENRARVIAGITTGVIAMLLLLLLYFGRFDFSPRQMAAASVPEPEEEIFLEPELLDPGVDNREQIEEPAPAPKGEPERVDEEPQPVAVKGATVKTEKPVIAEPERKVRTDRTNGAFARDNGAEDGTLSSQGAGGAGVGISGAVSGRSLLSCPKPDVMLRNRTVIKVRVSVDAEGRTVSAKALSGGDAALRSKCEQAARGARWQPKEGAPTVTGTLTFTLKPTARR